MLYAGTMAEPPAFLCARDVGFVSLLLRAFEESRAGGWGKLRVPVRRGAPRAGVGGRLANSGPGSAVHVRELRQESSLAHFLFFGALNITLKTDFTLLIHTIAIYWVFTTCPALC